MADDGQIVIDASEEASIQMLDNPTNASTGGTTATPTMVSMFQTGSVALRGPSASSIGRSVAPSPCST